MTNIEDEAQAQMLAEKIVSAGDKGVAPNPGDVDALAAIVESQSKEVADALRQLNEKGSEVSVEDMFEMQMLMNHFSQLGDMGTNVVSAANSALNSMVRNFKG